MSTIRTTHSFVEIVAEPSPIKQAKDTAQSSSAQIFQQVSVGDRYRVRVQVTDSTGTVIIPRDSVMLNVLEITDAGTTISDPGGGGPGTWIGLTDTPSVYTAGEPGSLTRQNLAGDGVDFLANGATGQVLTMVGGVPAWAANAGTGVTTWLQLDDTAPTTYVGRVGQFSYVADTNGLDLRALDIFERITLTASTGSASGGPILASGPDDTSLTLEAGDNMTLTATGSTIRFDSAGGGGSPISGTPNFITKFIDPGGDDVTESRMFDNATPAEPVYVGWNPTVPLVAFNNNFMRFDNKWDLCSNAGNPNTVVFAGEGSLCVDTTNSALYIKTTPIAQNNGWIQIQLTTLGSPAGSISPTSTLEFIAADFFYQGAAAGYGQLFLDDRVIKFIADNSAVDTAGVGHRIQLIGTNGISVNAQGGNAIAIDGANMGGTIPHWYTISPQGNIGTGGDITPDGPGQTTLQIEAGTGITISTDDVANRITLTADTGGGGLAAAYVQMDVERYIPGGSDPDQSVVAQSGDPVRYASPTTNILFSATEAAPDLVTFDLGYLSDPFGLCEWSDGVFPWVSGETPIMDALCDLNRLLTSLAPPPAPDLSQLDVNFPNGEDGALTWGQSLGLAGYTNVDGIGDLGAVNIDQPFNDSGRRIGIIRRVDCEGDIQPQVGQTNNYDRGAFTDGDQGWLQLELNGNVIYQVDLTSYAGGDPKNGFGSGFENLSEIRTVTFDNGDPFDQFKYRAGLANNSLVRWHVDSNEPGWLQGWNYVRVVHTAGGSTNYADWVFDPVASGSGSVDGTDYANETMSGENGGNPLSYLSGVAYFTSATANYSVDIQKAYRNTYNTSGSAVDYIPTVGSTTPGSDSFDACIAKGQNLAEQAAACSVDFISGRMLGIPLECRVDVERVFNDLEVDSPGAQTGTFLVDTLADDGLSSDLNEGFDDEDYRVRSDVDITDTNYASGPGSNPAPWDPQVHMVDANPGPGGAPSIPYLYPNGQPFPDEPPHGTGTTYYVAASGGNNGNNGTSPGTAWGDMQFAVQQLSAGDTLKILGGTYTETGSGFETGWFEINNLVGTASEPIWIEAEDGQVVSYAPPSNPDNFCIRMSGNTQYVNVKGIRCELNSFTAGAFRCDSGTQNNQWWYCYGEGKDTTDKRHVFSLNGGYRNKCINCVAKGTGNVGPDAGGGGFEMKSDTGPNLNDANGVLNTVPQSGWATWEGNDPSPPPNSCSTECEVINCMSHDHTYSPQDGDGMLQRFAVDCLIRNCIVWAAGDDGIDFQGTARGTVDHSIVFEVKSGANNNGIRSDNKGSMLNRFYRNIIYDVEVRGLHISLAGGGSIFNNTVIKYLNDGIRQLSPESDGSGLIDHIYCCNNITQNIIDTGQQEIEWGAPSGDTLIYGANCWDGPNGISQSQAPSPANINSDPLFSGDGINFVPNKNYPAINNPVTDNTVAIDFIRQQFIDAFSISQGSPCENAGVVVPGFITSFQGTAPDIGALEFGGKNPSGPTGYGDGLLVYNGAVRQRTNGIFGGDFRDNSEGGSIDNAPLGNPDYTTPVGECVYIRSFYSPQATSNFNFFMNVTNTDFVAASNIGSLTGNNCTAEILAPNATKDDVGTVEWKDMVTPYTSDADIGAFAGQFGGTIPTNWGVSLGTVSTASSGNAILVRITAPASWSGSITQMNADFTP